MKSLVYVVLFLALARGGRTAEECDETKCQLPDCRCSSTSIPGGFPRHRTPQFVLLTFDDYINIVSIRTYRGLLYGLHNANTCPTGITYFVQHEHTDYQLVSELYNMGFEIALHSISHSNQTYFKEADYERMVLEFADQRKQMAHFAHIPIETIEGMRIPYLQLAGDESFKMMQDAGLRYDISWPTVQYTEPGLWPYTLHYASIQDCVRPPCPTSSIPGPWVVPMIAWFDLQGEPCLSVDLCPNLPDKYDVDGWFRLMVNNFERHYAGNRAPFGFHIHETTIRNLPGVRRAIERFFEMIHSMNDVFMVNVSDMLDWVQNPVPLEEYIERPCNRRSYQPCYNSFCGPLIARDRDMDMYISICNSCPRVYPWVGNPFGH